jgi:hypothetical protein
MANGSLAAMALFALSLAPFFPAKASPAPQGKKEYLSDTEADKIRDADSPSARIKLYLSFADDRLKKFQYELSRTTAERRRAEILNSLLNAYVGCVDDAADQVALAGEKQMDIHQALKEFSSKGKTYLSYLQKLNKDSPDYDSYQETLQDAIEGTEDALADVDKAQKEAPPAPVRRKPS